MTIEITAGIGVVALSLWTGSENGPEPGGWQDLSFDDAAWHPALSAYINTAGEAPAPFAEAVWPSYTPLSDTEVALFRHRFTLPADLVSATIVLCYDDIVTAVYLNGRALPVRGQYAYPPSPEAIPIDSFIASGDNVLALRGANTLGGPAYISYQLLVQTLADTNTSAGAGVADGGSYGAPLTAAVRLKHATGDVDWEHDGTLFRVRSRGRTCVQAPFPTMGGQPAALLGRDPGTGLPMWAGTDAPPPAPAPPPVSRTYSHVDRSLEGTHDAPDPLPVPPSAQRVCGAAEAMTDLVCVIYDAIVQVINKAKSDIIADFTQGLKAEISAEIGSLLTEGEFAAWAIDAVQLGLTILAQIVQTLLNWGTSLALIWPPNPLGHAVSQQFNIIRCAAWQVLWLTGGDYLSQSKSADGLGTKDYWVQYLAPQWSFFAGSTQSGISQSNPPWQLVWINAIINHVSDGGWAFAAAKGAQQPSTGCAGCAGYPT